MHNDYRASTRAFAVSLACGAGVAGFGCQGHALTVQYDNDDIVPSGSGDRWYTHGTRVEWMLPEEDSREVFGGVLNALPLFPEIRKPAVTFAAGQQIFTPDDTGTRRLVPDDRPYAGWLYGGILFQNLTPGNEERRDDRLDMWEIDAGIIGPSSLAGRTQRFAHRLLNNTPPRGWTNQLEDEPGLALRYDRLDRRLYREYEWPRHFQLDLITDAGFSLGNVDTSARFGGTVRFGGLRRDFITRSISPALTAGDGTAPALPGYLLFGIDARLVGYTVFLDGNTYRSSHSVAKRFYTVDFSTGIVFPFDRLTVGLVFVVRTPEFTQTSSFQRYGSVRITLRL